MIIWFMNTTMFISIWKQIWVLFPSDRFIFFWNRFITCRLFKVNWNWLHPGAGEYRGCCAVQSREAIWFHFIDSYRLDCMKGLDQTHQLCVEWMRSHPLDAIGNVVSDLDGRVSNVARYADVQFGIAHLPLDALSCGPGFFILYVSLLHAILLGTI